MATALIERTPRWEYRADHELTQGYGHVELHGPYAVGQWFCVELATGRVMWEHQATTIRGVDMERGVIVATETINTC